MFYDAISAHESEYALLILVEAGRFDLREECSEVLGLGGKQLVSFGVEINL